MTDTPEEQNQPESDTDATPSAGRKFSLGRSSRRIAVGASIAVAFLGGMVVYRAVDDRDIDADQAALVTPEGGNSNGIPGGGPGWHDDDGDREHFDDDRYERGDDDRYERDDRYESDDRNEMGDRYEKDDRYDDDYAPMQSGQS